MRLCVRVCVRGTGTYRSGDSVVKIAAFVPTLTVITSKQRPRKLVILGSDGREYQYLLKGHEDPRQVGGAHPHRCQAHRHSD
jgi:phosphatidylinositol kinase/protein kinase (PI-3  family)